MKFTGCNPLKSLEPVIELSSNGKDWDLHNVGEFLGFSYKSKERILFLEWKYFDEDGKPLNQLCILEFWDVLSFEVKKRDPEMPYSEDDCLSDITFNEADDSFIVKFMGGQEIKIFCNEIKFILT